MGFFLDQKVLNRKEPPKGEYAKLAAENKQYFIGCLGFFVVVLFVWFCLFGVFLHTVLRENTALAFDIISKSAR